MTHKIWHAIKKNKRNQIKLYLFSLTKTKLVTISLSVSKWLIWNRINKTAGEEARRQLHKNVASNIEQVLAATPHKAPTIRPPTSNHENYPSFDEPDMQGTAGEAGTSS